MNQLLAGAALVALVGFSGFFGAIGIYKAGENAARTEYQLASAKAALTRQKQNSDARISELENRDKHEQALQNQVRTEHDRANAHANRLWQSLHPAPGGVLGQLATSSTIPFIPSKETLVDDATSCTDNTLKAEGWLGWWQDAVEKREKLKNLRGEN